MTQTERRRRSPSMGKPTSLLGWSLMDKGAVMVCPSMRPASTATSKIASAQQCNFETHEISRGRILASVTGLLQSHLYQLDSDLLTVQLMFDHHMQYMV
jgi:hypothetical protein